MSTITCSDVGTVDVDMFISVGTTLLVPSPQGMDNLMHHHPFRLTQTPDGDDLSASLMADTGVAAAENGECFCWVQIVLSGKGNITFHLSVREREKN